MKQTRFTEEQMVTILREGDERPVPEVAKKHGVSAQTIYGWRKHCGTLEPTDVKRLRQLEQETSCNRTDMPLLSSRLQELGILRAFTENVDDLSRARALPEGPGMPSRTMQHVDDSGRLANNHRWGGTTFWLSLLLDCRNLRSAPEAVRGLRGSVDALALGLGSVHKQLDHLLDNRPIGGDLLTAEFQVRPIVSDGAKPVSAISTR